MKQAQIVREQIRFAEQRARRVDRQGDLDALAHFPKAREHATFVLGEFQERIDVDRRAGEELRAIDAFEDVEKALVLVKSILAQICAVGGVDQAQVVDFIEQRCVVVGCAAGDFPEEQIQIRGVLSAAFELAERRIKLCRQSGLPRDGLEEFEL